MSGFMRGVLGLGVTLFVVASAMGTVNGLVRGFAGRRLVANADDEWARAALLLF